LQALKGFLSIGFTLLLFLQITSRVWVVLTYQLNKAYIIENLCQNRDVPLVLCSGKCVVAKQINEEGSSSKGQMPQKQLATLEVCYISSIPDWPLFSGQVSVITSERPVGNPFKAVPAPPKGILKPPCITLFTT
jgi:hypothetical protein